MVKYFDDIGGFGQYLLRLVTSICMYLLLLPYFNNLNGIKDGMDVITSNPNDVINARVIATHKKRTQLLVSDNNINTMDETHIYLIDHDNGSPLSRFVN